jgi:hypothetical protein
LILESRLVESTHISRGIMQMRMSVMELGRFTAKSRRGNPEAILDYPPAGFAKATRKREGVYRRPEDCLATLRARPRCSG